MADWLSLTERGLNQPVVTRYVGGFTRTSLSAAFGTNIATEDTVDAFQANCVLQTDDDTIFAVTYTDLWRSTDSGATFTSVLTFGTPATDNTAKICHGGIHYVYDAGNQEVLLGGWVHSGSLNVSGWTYRLSDGATTETTFSKGSTGQYTLGSEILYGTSIHSNVGSGIANEKWLSFDVASQTWSSYTFPTTHLSGAAAASDYAVGPDGALYALFAGEAPGNLYAPTLFRFTGSWSSLGLLTTAINDGAIETGARYSRLALWSDGTDLHALYLTKDPGFSYYGWRHKKILASQSFDPTLGTDLTAGLPAHFRVASDGGSITTNTPNRRAIVVQDTESTPGTLRTYVAFSEDADPGTPYELQEYNGSWAFVGSGGNVRDGLPQASHNGGGYFYTPAQDGVRITQVSAALGSETISFIASGGGTVTIQFRYGRNQQDATSIATLIGTATGGGTRTGNTVTSVTADGTTVNTVSWDFVTDGVSAGEALVALVPETV